MFELISYYPELCWFHVRTEGVERILVGSENFNDHPCDRELIINLYNTIENRAPIKQVNKSFEHIEILIANCERLWRDWFNENGGIIKDVIYATSC